MKPSIYVDGGYTGHIQITDKQLIALQEVCAHCTGLCCRAFAIRVTPEANGAIDWSKLSDTNKDFYAQNFKQLTAPPAPRPDYSRFACKQVGADGKCQMYATRPPLCWRRLETRKERQSL